MEENNSDMELIVPSDTDAEDGLEECVKNHQPYTSKSSHPTPRHICIMAVTTLTTFAFGSLVGYLVCTKIYTTSCTEPEFSDSVVQRETIFDWSNLTALLRNKLTTDNIENSLSEFSSDSHQAGSVGEDVISENIFRRFSEFGLSTWRDEFFVKVQDHPKGGTNGVTFYGTKFDESGYLAYSGNGSVEGAVLYCYYGQVSDFRNLQDLKVSPKGKIVLVRAGKISFAEKVANAASVNASAVLIYPDPADYSFDEGTDLFGHVHLGCGDPYTPGFPSFNHIQFPAVKSSGLPSIPAQTIRARGLQNVTYKLGGDNDVASVEVNNVLIEKRIHNVFGVIKGFIDADRYVVIGAQRDAWGPGYAKSTVGTSLLVELARTISDIINGFKPRRSIVFASWSAGEYGAVGATEWLEGYLSSLNMKAFSYISLDGVVTGSSFKASASPLMYDLIQSTLKEVTHHPAVSVMRTVIFVNSMEPMRMVDSAYPFQTFSGIPSVSFRFISGTGEYPFFGTMLDTRKNLDVKTSQNLLVLVKTAGEVAGQMALRLVHDHLLRLNVENYSNIIRAQVAQINKEVYSLQMSNRIPKTLEMQWLMSAMGSYSRASRRLTMLIQNSDLQDSEQCRIINDRIMGVEKDLLSPYVSPRESPFRHILLGSGSHTVGALLSHLAAIKEGSASADINLLKNQFALTTWTIQSCANALAGNVWEMDNQI
uniref:Transferrin receptor protein 1 n=1 Tax=Electrophorus electricus TaxID=8005 RepID=A0A4W4ENY0_ELEEL